MCACFQIYLIIWSLPEVIIKDLRTIRQKIAKTLIAQKYARKIERKKIPAKYFEKNLGNIPKISEKLAKIPNLKKKLKGFSDPQNISTLFLRVIYPSRLLSGQFQGLYLQRKHHWSG